MSKLVVSIGHVEFTGGSEVLYVVKVQQDADEWEVRRTFADFRRLRDDVLRVMKDARAHAADDASSRTFAHHVQALAFPPKRLFGARKDHVVKERAVELHHFLIKLLMLTHTYRKAQKALYEGDPAAFAALQDRTQASIGVFYLLRDFLKPVTLKTDVTVLGALGGGVGGDHQGHNADRAGGVQLEGDGDDDAHRMIRESKMLAMSIRNSLKSSTASARTASHRVDETADRPPRSPARSPVRSPARSPVSTHAQPRRPAAQGRSRSATRLPSTRSEEDERPAGPVLKTASLSALSAQVDRARAESHQLRDHLLQQRKDKQRHEELEHAHVAGHHRQFKEMQQQQKEGQRHHSRRHHSSTGDLPVEDGADGHRPLEKISARVVSASAGSAREARHVLITPEMQEQIAGSGQSGGSGGSRPNSGGKASSEKRKPRSKRSRRKQPQSAHEAQARESERLSRMSTQLTAQAISVTAQKEVEKVVSEYTAIMVLRYVDRFISKAVTKAPGCYRVDSSRRLVIDSERFVEELELTFTDLPDAFAALFQDESGDWRFPHALDKYVQMKWQSFQGNAVSSTGSTVGSRPGSDAGSDESDSEYEYEQVGGGGFMKAKKDFSHDEESMLQEMIANGTATRDQTLRLQRQVNEQGWHRRANPSYRALEADDDESEELEEDSSSTEDDSDAARRRRRHHKKKAASHGRTKERYVGHGRDDQTCTVEQYQQRQNARRKDRLSRVGTQTIGGLV